MKILTNKLRFFKTPLIAAFLVLACSSSAIEVHLEHSLVINEGSLWGTEDSFVESILVNKDLVPGAYKTKVSPKGNTKTVNISHIAQAKGRFINNRVVLFKELNVCWDPDLPSLTHQFTGALNYFRHKLGLNSLSNPPHIRFFFLSSVVPFQSCDLIIVKGAWDRFPYNHLRPPRSSKHRDWEQVVYGSYFRLDPNSIPVITIHPDIILDFSAQGTPYTRSHAGQLIVDGTTLILHELAHFLGFSHLGTLSSSLGYPELTAMGLTPIFRDELSNLRRFRQAKDLWRYWDPIQTGIYQKVLNSVSFESSR